MSIPSFLKGESIVRLLQGGALGAIVTLLLGFNWGGWVLGSTAARQAEDQTETALVSALAPICVERFQSSPNKIGNLETLSKQPSYKRTNYIEDGGWAILPGSEKATPGVAKACAILLVDA